LAVPVGLVVVVIVIAGVMSLRKCDAQSAYAT